MLAGNGDNVRDLQSWDNQRADKGRKVNYESDSRRFSPSEEGNLVR